MGGFDTYCAICGSSLTGGDIGSSAPSALRRRRRIVTRKREARESGNPDPESEDEDDDEEDRDDEQEWWLEDEDCSYDPDLVSEESLEWLAASRCLGVNPLASGESKAFISGSAVSCDDGCMEVEIGSDPNQPSAELILHCYTRQDPHGLTVFPFHDCCLDILTEVLTGSKDVAEIDKDVLCDVMFDLTTAPYATCLELDCGSVTGRDQRWESVPGEEFSVTKPITTPEVTELLKKFLGDHVFVLRPDSPSSITRKPQVQDPFSVLPPEMLRNVFRFLSSDALLALLKASWPAFCATRGNAFWKWFLKHDMPWLAELWPLLDEQRQGTEISYKALCMWLNEVTKPRYGMDSPFMCVANRRRIWGMCEQLASRYFQRLQVMHLDEPDRSIFEGATCRHMAFIADDKQPPNNSWTVQRTLFAYFRDDIVKKAAILEAYWGEDGRLIGLCAVFGKHRRSFGLNSAHVSHTAKTAMRIDVGDRITAVVLRIATTDPNNGATASSSPAVVGMKVHTRAYRWVSLEPGLKHSLEMPFLRTTLLSVSDGACLVGITGHIDHGGAIRSIGLMEATLSPTGAVSFPTSMSPSEIAPCNHRSWASATPLHLMPCGTNSPSFPYHVFSLTTMPSKVSLIPDHMIPYEVLVWATGKELAKLARISLYLGRGTSNDSGRAAVVHGLRVEYIRRYWEPKRYVGMRKNVGQCDDPPTWPEDQVISLEVDGPGGERIDEIAVSEGSPDALSFKIKTNLGREVYVGEAGSQGWTSRRAPAGESIIGLIASFTGKTTVPGYGGLSSLLVLTNAD